MANVALVLHLKKDLKLIGRKREIELREIFNKFKQNSYWDCIIPVSGGKDSTYQVLKVLEYGLKPLCVTSTTCDLSDLGKKILKILKALE